MYMAWWVESHVSPSYLHLTVWKFLCGHNGQSSISYILKVDWHWEKAAVLKSQPQWNPNALKASEKWLTIKALMSKITVDGAFKWGRSGRNTWNAYFEAVKKLNIECSFHHFFTLFVSHFWNERMQHSFFINWENWCFGYMLKLYLWLLHLFFPFSIALNMALY